MTAIELEDRRLTDQEKRQIARMAAQMAVELVEEKIRNRQVLLTTEEAARMLGMSPASLRTMRNSGDNGPAFIRLTDSPKSPVRYHLGDIRFWISMRSRQRATRLENDPDAIEANQIAHSRS